jgi:glycosyltransferase involved in cell wall biosynthesis
MNPGPPLPEQAGRESDFWDVILRIPGPENRTAVQFVYDQARQTQGLIVLSSPSPRIAVSAVLGATQSGSNIGAPSTYLIDSRRQQLMLLFNDLNKADVAGEVTLYHGSPVQFFRDLPLRIALFLTDSESIDSTWLRFALSAGSRILSLGGAVREDLKDTGLLEIEDVSAAGVCYRATDRCRGPRYVPTTSLRVAVQSSLHERYLLSEISGDAGHTPVADLTQAMRREFSRQVPDASGLASWPYAAPESAPLPPTLPSGKSWPRISIVTPSRNQGAYIEETILSVLHQNYPDLEYIVVDGASTDQTPAILERYRDRLSLIISEPDTGQSNAINKGMAKTTGDILTWLNSDDMLAPGALAAAALAFDTHSADMIAGLCQIYRDGVLESQHLTCCPDGELPVDELLDLEQGWNAGQFFMQPEVMFGRDIWQRAGGYVEERYFYSMDYELWLRFAHAGARLHVIGRPMAWFRTHEEQKTYEWLKVLREQVAARDTFAKNHGVPVQAPVSIVPSRQNLRIALLNDIGGAHGAGIAHVRLARALASAGHDIELIAILESFEMSGRQQVSSESVLDRVAASRPDLVIVGNLHAANADPFLLHMLAERFPTLVVLHDLWIFTGRCAYTGNCEKYLQGCDATCPTPNEYPVLAPSKIADAWRKKRYLLGTKSRPALLANSEWTAAFARRALAPSFTAGRAPSVEVFRLSFPLDVFRPRNKQSCRERFGLPPDRFLVLLPASLDEARKGARSVLEALASLEVPNLLVVTIGWPSADALFSVEVVQLGYLSDPHSIAMLNSAVDVVIAPSSAETFGQIFIEAIACGTPVVGYPVTAVPEAIRDGVTGLLACDGTPESLAAAVHHLYIHPELRRDLAGWGRLYVENEWSEAGAYYHFFVALRRLGLDKTLNLRRNVELLPAPPVLPKIRGAQRTGPSWRPGQGFSAIERSPQHHLDSFRWAYWPAAYAELLVDSPGEYHLLIRYRNVHEGQEMKLRLNGELLGTDPLAKTGVDHGSVFIKQVSIPFETNLLQLEFSKWDTDQSARPLAVMITDVLCENASMVENTPPSGTSGSPTHSLNLRDPDAALGSCSKN